MPTTDTNVWDYVVTYGGPSLFMTAVFLFVMPIVWFKLARPRFKRWPSRLAVMLAVWMTAWFIAYGDVLMIAREAKRVCETEAGLKVYRTVEAEGFAGTNDIVEWAEQGFSYVEFRSPGGEIFRYRLVDGKREASSASQMISRYEYAVENRTLPQGIVSRAEQVREISTHNILGERIMFEIPPGRLDRKLIGGLGFHRNPVWCVAPTVVTSETSLYPASEVIKRTLKSRKKAHD